MGIFSTFFLWVKSGLILYTDCQFQGAKFCVTEGFVEVSVRNTVIWKCI